MFYMFTYIVYIYIYTYKLVWLGLDWLGCCSSFKSLVRAANEEEEQARDAKMEQAEREEQAKKKAAAEAEAAAAAAAATAKKEKEAAAAAAAAKLSAMNLADEASTGIDKVIGVCMYVHIYVWSMILFNF